MIETDESGDAQLKERRKNQDSSVFNDWEQRFIKDVGTKCYRQLTKHQKAVVTRLFSWLMGG